MDPQRPAAKRVAPQAAQARVTAPQHILDVAERQAILKAGAQGAAVRIEDIRAVGNRVVPVLGAALQEAAGDQARGRDQDLLDLVARQAVAPALARRLQEIRRRRHGARSQGPGELLHRRDGSRDRPRCQRGALG